MNSRRIGIAFELKIVHWLKRWWREAARSFGQARSGDENPDIVGTPFWLECKDRKSISEAKVQAMYQIAVKESKYTGAPGFITARPPILIYRNKSKSTKGRKGKSYIRIVMFWNIFTALEDKGSYYGDRSECKTIGEFNTLVEMPLDFMSDTFDYAFSVANKEEG